MKTLWQRLESWVAANTDADLALRPGASAAKLDAVEQAIGRPLPADLRESFAEHDGQELPSLRWFGGERRLHPLSSILDQWTWDRDSSAPELPDELADQERVRVAMSHRGRLPLIGVTYWDGDNLYADSIPGPAGAEGQILYRQDIELMVLAPSWRAFLTRIVEGLEGGQLVYAPGVRFYPDAKGRIVPSEGVEDAFLALFAE